MKKKKRVKADFYKDDDPTDEDFPAGKLTRIPDFLPPPNELAKAKAIVKVTIGLDQVSVDFFKRQAKKHKTKYQRMIRAILDRYTARYRAA